MLNTVRFVTFCCYRRQKLLVHDDVISLFIRELRELRVRRSIRIFGYVVMPEHVHLVLHPPDSLELGPAIGELKSKSASAIIASGLITLPDACVVMKNGVERRAFWQPRCYDHNCRSREIVLEKLNYCHDNPVKRKLVDSPGDWRWSSHNWYCGVVDIPLEMDVLDEELSASILEKPT